MTIPFTPVLGDEGLLRPKEVSVPNVADGRSATQWRPMEVKPSAPTMAVMAIITPETVHLNGFERGRDERYELAWWTGDEWCESGTAHSYDERRAEQDGFMPTHWSPLTAPDAVLSEEVTS